MHNYKTPINNFKPDSEQLQQIIYETTVIRHAVGIFGLLVRRGNEVFELVADMLDESESISASEFYEAVDTVLLWGGEHRGSLGTIVLVVEVSWRGNPSATYRAKQRARILQKIGIKAFPVVCGKEWRSENYQIAIENDVVIVEDRLINTKMLPRELMRRQLQG